MNQLPKIFIYPGNLEVSKKPIQLTTILGSCVAVCIWDAKLKFGGMNHFMLPLWNGEGLASPKYGNIAIDKLVKKMIWNGSSIENLEAKIFGGGNVIETSNNIYKIGDRNIELALSKIDEYGIKIIGSSTGGKRGRKILMDTSNFKILHKFIEKRNF
jgi:chemotaxis protein CheD